MMKKILKLGGLLLAAIVLLGAVLVVNTLLYSPDPIESAATSTLDLDNKLVAEHLAAAIRFKTISTSDSEEPDEKQFEGFISYLEETYKNAHSAMKLERINQYSLLYKWTGSEPSLKPILLTGHYDVVPVASNVDTDWSHPPFEGVIADNHVWGRGALDDKGSVIAIMEAAERLLKDGFSPKRTIYFAFGHDEEIGGNNGAGAIVSKLKSENIQFLWSLDEGSMVLDGIVPGLPHPVASINVAEKGYLSIDLVAKGRAGHSSMPPRQTAIGSLAKAIDRLQENPVPGGLTGVSGEFFDRLGRYFSFEKRMAFANVWLFGGLLENELGKAHTTNAMLRTTTAPTIISGGVKENVLPAKAIATINFRLHPRDTKESILAYVKKTIDDDGIEIIAHKWHSKPSAVSSATSQGYKNLEATFKKVFSPVITLPGLTIAATDSAHYSKIADDTYRILPMQVTNEDINGFHGANERLSIKNLVRAVSFYHELLILSAGEQAK